MSMSVPPPDPSRALVTVEPARVRQTAPPATPFRDVLAGGVGVLLAGAQVATSVVGVPVLAAAVRGARSEALGAGAGSAPLAGAAAASAALTPGSELATMHAMQRESQAFNLQLLELQEEVQQENRRFSTLSNVVRARHDTAKAAVGNIRS